MQYLALGQVDQYGSARSDIVYRPPFYGSSRDKDIDRF
jgi:hypothetical protein